MGVQSTYRISCKATGQEQETTEIGTGDILEPPIHAAEEELNQEYICRA